MSTSSEDEENSEVLPEYVVDIVCNFKKDISQVKKRYEINFIWKGISDIMKEHKKVVGYTRGRLPNSGGSRKYCHQYYVENREQIIKKQKEYYQQKKALKKKQNRI